MTVVSRRSRLAGPWTELHRQVTSPRTRRAPILPLLAYVVSLVIIQLLAAGGYRSASLVLAILLVVISLATGLWMVSGITGADDEPAETGVSPAVQVLAALLPPPLTVIVALGVTWETSGLYVEHFANVPILLVSALLVVRAARLSRRDLALDLPRSLRAWLITGLAGGFGAVLGWILFELIEPGPPMTVVQRERVALLRVLYLLGGIVEEFIYRGVMRGAMDRGFEAVVATFLGATVLAVMTIGFQSLPAVALVWITAMLADSVVRRTQSLAGVALGRGVCLVFLFVILPLERAGPLW